MTVPVRGWPRRHRALGRAAAALVLAALLTAVAAAPASARETVTVLAAPASIDQVLTNIRNWIVGILAALATVFLTIGGARYVMAGGDPGEVERARAALRSAAFGYGLAVLAPLIVQVLQGIVGG
ncbi:pilin [Pseudonocardia sp.]|uniref:pilin n=1 Tax=Pseudonocardia sp. TaxID=60912 RepID=UPI003D0F67CC